MAHFEFRNVTSCKDTKEGGPVLTLKGELESVSEERRRTPSIRYRSIGFLGLRRRRQLIYEGAGLMDAGQKRDFSLKIYDPLSLLEGFDLVIEER